MPLEVNLFNQEIRALGSYGTEYLVVSADNDILKQDILGFTYSKFLPLSGGIISGNLSITGDLIEQNNTNVNTLTAEGSLVLKNGITVYGQISGGNRISFNNSFVSASGSVAAGNSIIENIYSLAGGFNNYIGSQGGFTAGYNNTIGYASPYSTLSPDIFNPGDFIASIPTLQENLAYTGRLVKIIILDGGYTLTNPKIVTCRIRSVASPNGFYFSPIDGALQTSSQGYVVHFLTLPNPGGFAPTALGSQNIALGDNAFVTGFQSAASGLRTFASGFKVLSLGDQSVAFGNLTRASGKNSFTTGFTTSATGDQSIAVGNSTFAQGLNTFALGFQTKALGNESTAAGQYTSATGLGTFAIGFCTNASGDYSFAEGSYTRAIGNYSHAEGFSTVAANIYDHAEGDSSIASGSRSHAGGSASIASGYGSYARGQNVRAIGSFSRAEGNATVAKGNYSHAAGQLAVAAHDNSWIWNSTFTDYVSTTRTNQFMVSANGGVYIPGNIGIGTDANDQKLTVVGNISAVGNIETSPYPNGYILMSPNGTRFKLTIANTGLLNATQLDNFITVTTDSGDTVITDSGAFLYIGAP